MDELDQSSGATLSPHEAGFLLGDLCVKLGVFLPIDAQEELIDRPPREIDAFAEAAFRAERMDPNTGDRDLYRMVRAMVAKAFLRAAERDV